MTDSKIEVYNPLQSGDKPVISSHTGYKHPDSESWEHDDTGDIGNLSGCVDDANSATAEHKGWQDGYDYYLFCAQQID